MKTMFSILSILLLTSSLALAETDEERLDTLIDTGHNKKAQYQEKKQKEKEQKKEEQVETKTVTTITVTTQVTVIREQNTPVTPSYNPGKGRIGFGTLVLAEFLGAITPGLGMAHFTVGDTRGGLITLGITGVSLALYLSAEIMIETRTIDNPTTYGIMHYGAMGLFLVSYLYDLIGTPVYTVNYNNRFTASISPLQPNTVAFVNEKVQWGLNLIDVKIRF